MLVELSPPLLAALFVVMVLALVMGIIRATRPSSRMLPERVEPAAVAERLAAKVERHPTVAFSERVHGVPVAVWPAFPVGFVARPEWRVLVGVHLDTARDHDELYATIATRLSAIEAERARSVRP
jgi:hypothetical protein